MTELTTEQTPSGQRLDLSLWRELWSYTRPYRREVRALAFCALITAAGEVAFPLVTGRLVDDLAVDGTARLWPYVLVYAGVALMLFASVRGFVHLGGRIRTAVLHDIRRDGFDNLQQLSFAYFDRRPVGWLMARMTSDCDRLSNILAWGVLDCVWALTMMSGIAACMFWLHPALAGLTLIVVPVLALLSWGFQRRILTSARMVRKTNSRLTAAYNEGLMGVRTTKSFARERAARAEFDELAGEMHGASVRNATLSALYLPLVIGLGSCATALVLWRGGFAVSYAGLSLGTFVTFLVFMRQFFDPVQELAAWFAEMQMAQASAERILGLIHEESDVRDDPELLRDDDADASFDDVVLEDVHFAYGDGVAVLSNVNVTLPAGETIALVGPTGGGKSTLVALLCRFYEPTAGSIRIGGVDYRERSLAWLQSQLGIVLQTPHLFSGTLGDNIRYGKLDASDEEVAHAARLVGADAFVSKLPAGYATEVGEGGARLSTGEKQLVSFARAILADPRLLVLDEATSSIDPETEHRLQAALETVLEGRTALVIAHRLSTVRGADRILVVDGGGIAEQGSHAELLARRGLYHELYTRQAFDAQGAATAAWTAEAAPTGT